MRHLIFRSAAALLCALALPGFAHDIANSVSVQAYVKPSAQQLQLLVRVPLIAMQEMDFPRRGPGYLDLARTDDAMLTGAARWLAGNIDMYGDDTRLATPRVADVRVSLPADKSFASYEEAIAHLASPALPKDAELYWNQGYLDVLFIYPIQSAHAGFSIDPRLAPPGLQIVTALQFMPPASASRAFQFHGNPGLVRLDPRWHQAALRFVESGFLHILDGTDHLLFILCLVIPFRKIIALVWIVTAFTVAHSITLIASAFGHAPGGLWFPPLVEILIAISIVYMALENIVGANLRRRWMIAFAFGLVHGFGFSFVLRETLQFAGQHLVTSLLAFNVGVELGQLLVLALLVPALNLLFKYAVPERIGTIILSALVAHTGWHWMLERAERLQPLPWLTPDAAALSTATRWLMALMVLAGMAWLARMALRYNAQRRRDRTRR